MAPAQELVYDDLTSNGLTSVNSPWLSWKAKKIHVDALSMGRGEGSRSKNHWYLVLACNEGHVRLDLRPLWNEELGDTGVLTVGSIPYPNGESFSVIHRETHVCKFPGKTVSQVLDLIFANSWHRYSFVVTSGGHKKGCRYLMETMLLGFIEDDWVKEKSESGRRVRDYLHSAYHQEPGRGVEKHDSPIDKGKFHSRSRGRGRGHRHVHGYRRR